MAVATEVVARFTADVSDIQSKMAGVRGAFDAVSDAATFSSAQIRNVGQTMADVGTKMTVGITLPLAGVAAAATNAAMSFETSMTKIIGLVGIASDEVGRMGDEVLAMSGAVGKSPDELAAGLFVVTSAGLRGSEAMAVLGNSARAGAAGLGETNDIARAVAGALSAYGSEVLSASDATDAIVATARAGNFETSQFAAAIGRVLPFAQQAGASFQEMGGAVALLTRVNGDAAQSVTQIQALFRAFVVPTEEAKTALAEMGMSAQDLRDSIAKKGLPATLEMLDRALGGNREQLGRLLGSSEAASAAFSILGADAATIAETFGGVRNSAGMTAEAFGAVANTTQFQVNQAMAELKATLIDLGNQFLPIVKSVMDFAKAHLSAFNSLPGPVKTFITVMAGIFAILGPILLVVGKLIMVFSTLLSLMLKTKAVGAMRAAFIGLRGDLAASRASMKQSQTSIGMLGTTAATARVAVVSSFKAIGAAAKGLLAGLGPIGLAMLAIGGAIEIFIGKAAGAEHHLSNLRDEIDLTTGKMTEAARLFIASELRTNISPEDLAMMESYGISISGFISALEQGGPALDAYREKIAAMQQAQSEMGGAFNTGFGNIGTVNSINTIVENLDGMIGYYQDATLAAQDAAAAQVDSAVAAGDAARGMAESYREAAQKKRAADRAMTDSQRALDAALDAGVEAVEALSEAFNKMNEAIANEASRDAAIQGIKDLNASLEENGSVIKKNSDEAMANRAAIREAAQGWIDYAAKAKDPEQAQKRLAQGQEEIRKALKAAGIKPKDSDIFKVFKAQQTESKRTVDEFAAQRDVAAKYGNEVGMNFIDGIIAELERRKEEVRTAAAAVTSGLTTGGNDGIDATSPSRDAMQVAGNFVDGITVGLRNRASDVREEGSKLGRGLAQAFTEALNGAAGSISGAINEIFGSIPTKSPLEELLGEEAAEKFVKNNTKALQALAALGDAFDVIAGKVAFAVSAIQQLSDLTSRPFGRPSEIMNMFGSETDIDGIIDSYLNLAQTLRDAFSVLTDPSVVGAEAARINRKNLQGYLKSLENLTRQAIALREEYEANLEALKKLEEDYANDVRDINARYDQLDKEAADSIKAIEDRWAEVIPGLESAAANARNVYERENAALQSLINERDGFLKQIADGARSFLNSLSFTKRKAEAAAAEVTPEKQIIETIQDLGNGIRVVTKREITPAAEAVAEAVEEPLSAIDIRSSLESRLSELRAFSQNIRTLVERGLDPELVRQFVTAGVSGAGEAAAALAAGSTDEIAAINAVQNALATEVAQFGQYAADEWHAAAIAQQEAVVGAALTQQEIAEKALAQATAMRDKELKAAQDHADSLRKMREDELAAAEAVYNAEKARLEERNRVLLEQMDAIAQLIQNFISRIVGNLPQQTENAGQDAAQKLLNGFKKKYPKVFSELNQLMNQLAQSMNRVVTVTVRTVYESAGKVPARAMGGPVQARTAYLVGERGPEVFVPYGRGNIIPNHALTASGNMALGNVPPMGTRAAGGGTAIININVNAGMGADGAEIGRHIVDSLRQYERRNGPIPVSVTG